MKFTVAAAAALTSVTAVNSLWFPDNTVGSDLLAAKGLLNVGISQLVNGLGHDTKTCSLRNAVIRREWTTLLPSERKAYTDAVLCLSKLPSKMDPAVAPGAKTRFDDFVAIHVQQTLRIHATASFLAWHRLFTWNYEQALVKECGYKGAQPYWNWGKTASDPLGSPVFDGSAYSMSGNGVYYPHNCTDALGNGVNCIPEGAGGGCVETGPFKKGSFSVNVASLAPTLRADDIVPGGYLAYNPRCLRRDVSQWLSSRFSTDAESVELLKKDKITTFQDYMQGTIDGVMFKDGFYGVHAAGHYTIGGDPGGDFFVSPGDPAFYLHHAQIDRTWWIWQNQDLKTRLTTNAVGGSINLGNNPPARDGLLTDNLEMGVLGISATIGDVINTQGGPLCYIYI